jgi:hypothetical protein
MPGSRAAHALTDGRQRAGHTFQCRKFDRQSRTSEACDLDDRIAARKDNFGVRNYLICHLYWADHLALLQILFQVRNGRKRDDRQVRWSLCRWCAWRDSRAYVTGIGSRRRRLEAAACISPAWAAACTSVGAGLRVRILRILGSRLGFRGLPSETLGSSAMVASIALRS